MPEGLPSRAGAGSPRPAAPSAPPLTGLLEQLKAGGRARTQGLLGASRDYVLAQAARALGRPLLCVAADDEAALRLARDVSFFLRSEGPVLELPGDEVLPYDDVGGRPELPPSGWPPCPASGGARGRARWSCPSVRSSGGCCRRGSWPRCSSGSPSGRRSIATGWPSG